MFGIDENETRPVRIADVEWQIASVPWAKMQELQIDFAAAYEPVKEPPPKDAGVEAVVAYQRGRLALRRVYAEIVRWGVRGWDLPGLPIRREPVQYLGKPCEVLAAGVADYLARIDGGLLVEQLGLAVMRENRVSEADLLGFRSASPSATPT